MKRRKLRKIKLIECEVYLASSVPHFILDWWSLWDCAFWVSSWNVHSIVSHWSSLHSSFWTWVISDGSQACSWTWLFWWSAREALGMVVRTENVFVTRFLSSRLEVAWPVGVTCSWDVAWSGFCSWHAGCFFLRFSVAFWLWGRVGSESWKWERRGTISSGFCVWPSCTWFVCALRCVCYCQRVCRW